MPPSSSVPGDADIHATAAELRVLLGQLRRRLRDEAKPGDFSASQVAVLGRLERDGPATVTALAQAESMRPQSMGALIAALQSDGYVQGQPHPTDGRQVLYRVTPKCRAWIRTQRAAREDWLFRSIRVRFTATEQMQLIDAVQLLQRLIQP